MTPTYIDSAFKFTVRNFSTDDHHNSTVAGLQPPACNYFHSWAGYCALISLSLKGDKMTTITFERTGGLVGNEIYFDVDLDSVPEDEAKRLQKLIDSANFFNIPANIGMSATPDEFLYKITVDDGEEYHSVRATDTTMPKALHPLIRELTMLRVLSR
jgi:Emfourin